MLISTVVRGGRQHWLVEDIEMGKSSWSKYKLAPTYSNHTAVITQVSRTGVRRRDDDDAAETAWTWQISTLDLTIHLQIFPTQGQGDQISQQAAVSFLNTLPRTGTAVPPCVRLLRYDRLTAPQSPRAPGGGSRGSGSRTTARYV
jgi:hypothetical protein